MQGAYRALPGDVDLDGDLDVVVTAWLPLKITLPILHEAPLPSIVCLEQTEPGVFIRHTLETGFPYHATLEVADFDEDGDLDLATGPHVLTTRARGAQRSSHSVAVWWNQLISKGS
jgi:hypothetical protein